MLWRGIAAITVGAFLILFAMSAFLACGHRYHPAFRGDKPGPVMYRPRTY